MILKEEKKYTYLSSCYELHLNTRKGGKGQTTGRKLSYSAEHDDTGRQHLDQSLYYYRSSRFSSGSELNN
jgi:hypothetical protein